MGHCALIHLGSPHGSSLDIGHSIIGGVPSFGGQAVGCIFTMLKLYSKCDTFVSECDQPIS